MANLKPGRSHAVRAWLKAHGHKAARVNALKLATEDELREALCLLHAVRLSEYRRATKERKG